LEVYKLPVHLRNFYYKKLADAKKTENDSMKKQSNSAGKPKTPSKVRVNR